MQTPEEQPQQPSKAQAQASPLLETAEDAQKHRVERGETEPQERGATGLGRHYDVGGVADFGPVDTERTKQVDERDIPARVP